MARLSVFTRYARQVQHDILRAGTALILSAAFVALYAVPAAASPTVGSSKILFPASAQSVGEYQKFEISFPVTTSAINLQIPYDPVAPAYVANLKANEDARNGISVDALLLPPGQTDWTKAESWPCYYQQDFDANYYPLGTSAWHMRFAPTQLGVWTYEIRATDSSGTVTTTPSQFTCVASSSKGFVEVSPTDTRYFQYSDGKPFVAQGVNVVADMGDFSTAVNSLVAGQATGLIRIWIDWFGGLGVAGGFGEMKSSPVWTGNPDQADIQITDQDAHTGRYSLKIVPGTNGIQASLPLKGSTAYTFSAWVEPIGTSPGAQFTLFDVQNGNRVNLAQPLVAGSGWQQVQWTIPAGANLSSNGTFSVNLWNSTGGYILLDDVSVVDQNTGANLMGLDGGFEWQAGYHQRESAMFDTMVDNAEANGQYIKAVIFDKFDNSFSEINPDGTANPGNTNGDGTNAEASLGGSTVSTADTAVQRLQSYYARYLMARWGYATAIHSWEYTNEQDLGNGIEYAGAEAFGAAIHKYEADGRRLVTCSTCANDNGATYDPNFYENAALYPDIDYADYHFYPVAGAAYGPYLPYDDDPNSYNCRGFVRSTTGGPNNLGELTASASNPDYSPSDPNNMMNWINVYRVKGAGTWTIKYWYKTSSDVSYDPNSPWIVGGDGVDLYGYGNDATFALPWNETPSTPVTAWTEYSTTFQTIGSGSHAFDLRMRGNTLGGSVSYSDLRLYAPDGSLWTRVTFNEPEWDKDSASIVEYMGLSKEAYSGGPAIGKPLVIGECDQYNQAAEIDQDPQGTWARQETWAGALGTAADITCWWQNMGGWITQNGFWKFEGGVERFLQDVPLSNGYFRDLGASASPTLRIVGQKDVRDGLGVLWVQNAGHIGDGSDAANWYNIVENPGIVTPVNGTISVPGLTNGAYQVQYWSTVSGTPIGQTVLTTNSGVLNIPVDDLAQDSAIKFSPVPQPSLILQLTANPTTAKPGDLVTYTLTYTNTGSASALDVTVPWTVPAQMQYVSAGSGVFNVAQNTVTWNLGTLAPHASGTVSLQVRVK